MKTKNPSVKVCVCVRPLTEVDLNNGVNEVVSVDNQEVKISLGTDKGTKSYEMDFEPFYFGNLQGIKKSSIKEACDCFGSIVINNTFTGYNTSLFTYGCKSSGKSTIVFGMKNEKGLISTILEGLFKKASNYSDETSFRCEISFFEVCDDLITDLISKRSNVKSNEGSVKLKVREDPVRGPYIEKLSRHIITDEAEAQNLFSRGLKSRNRMAALDPNSKKTSSTIFTITFITASLKDGLPMELISRTNIIDIASEDGYPKYTNGFNSDIFGENEAEDEKQGPLEALNEVINKLASFNINPIKSYTNMSHSEQKIPYRDSNLTWLMKDALGGNSETIMICCLYPSEKNLRETLNTLKYGNLARHIQNKPQINEDQNVKLIRELKDEIEALKIDKNGAGKKNLHKLQRDQELMNRLTGIWETKWSKAQQMIEEKSLDVKDLGGKGLKLETKEPHFVSLGGGRLSVGVSIIPISKGFTRVGCGGDNSEVDLLIRGKGIASVHCLIEYDGEVVVLHPKNVLVSVDGMPLSEPTRLPQGCMVCIGQNNYFRFNHPREASKIKEMYSMSRFSIAPDDIYPDVQLAIEQRKIEIQEKERLQTENKRLLALEQQYMESLDRLTLEKDQLEHEKKKLQILQQQQQTIANQLDVKMTIQIEELKMQKEELQSFHTKNERIRAKEREIEMAALKLEEEQNLKEQRMKIEREALLNQQATLEKLEELATIKKSTSPLPIKIESLEEEKRRLALLELDILTEDLEYHDQFQKQKEEIQNQKQKLEEMESQHRYLIESLTSEIYRLQKERDAELKKIEKEKERLQVLEQDQSQALLTIEQERYKLLEARDKEKLKFDIEKEELEKNENKRLSNLQKTVEDQQRERDMITREKMKLADLEDAHKRALDELQQDIISQQEKHDRERKLELEYIEAEQLMLEELEQKQFEAVRQIEHETQIIRDQIDKEKLEEQARLKATERYIAEIKKRQEITLRQAEEEREKVKKKREEEQVQLQHERDKLAQIELEYQEISHKLREEQEHWRLQFVKEKEEICKVKNEYETQINAPRSTLNSLNGDIHNFHPDWMSRQLEEERLRLSELKRVAAEKAETEWNEENKNIYHVEIDKRKKGLETLKSEFKNKSEMQTMSILAEIKEIDKQEALLKQREQELTNLKIERERREELEKMLLNERQNEMLLEKSLLEEKVRLTTLEKSFAEERSKRVEVERRLQEEEERNKNDRKKLDLPNSTQTHENNGTLKRRLPSYTLSVRSGLLGNDQELNLLQYLTDAGHSIENSLDVRINRYSCRGYLLKMGHRFNISWKKRWFVFDRKLRALCYYQDEWKTKSKGILYFQSIQEVYVDNGVKRSPNPKTTFCIRTPQRTYVLNASTPIVMSIWIDVIITGREGGLMSMTL